MSPENVRSIDILEARCRDSHAAMCLARELLIEMLGDFMCGSGTGLSSEALWKFEEAVFVETIARHELQSYLNALEK